MCVVRQPLNSTKWWKRQREGKFKVKNPKFNHPSYCQNNRDNFSHSMSGCHDAATTEIPGFKITLTRLRRLQKNHLSLISAVCRERATGSDSVSCWHWECNLAAMQKNLQNQVMVGMLTTVHLDDKGLTAEPQSSSTLGQAELTGLGQILSNSKDDPSFFFLLFF